MKHGLKQKKSGRTEGVQSVAVYSLFLSLIAFIRVSSVFIRG
jgi:hypothetical protein